MALPFHTLSPPPAAEITGVAVFARLVDGVGFRYHWATEGLRPEDLDFSPGAGCMPLRQMLQHVHRMAQWVERGLAGQPCPPASGPEDLGTLRHQTLDLLAAIRAHALALGEKGLAQAAFPRGGEVYTVWNIVNGPLIDIVHHVGQIATYRRLLGNPVPKANQLLGQPPA